MGARRLAALGVVVALCGPLVPPAAAQSPSPFTEEALTRFLDLTMSAYPQTQGYLGFGVGFVDLDVDGDPDVVVIGRTDGRLGIFENVGGTFIDHTLTSGIPARVQQSGFAAADYDGDGLPDLYVTQAINQPNLLLRNLGSFTFSDETLGSLAGGGASNSTGPSWGDYNGDGWPDIYLSNYGNLNSLFRNNSGGTFTNLAFSLGVGGGAALSFQSVWSDYDRDGDVDLYLSNDRAPVGSPENILWRNDAGSFTDVSASSGADVSIYSMGIGAGDFDANGYPDFYLTNINAWESSGSGTGYDGINPLLLNQGDGNFVESAETWGVDNQITSWSAIFFDWDNDGVMDLYVNNQFEPNTFFHCTAPGTCSETAAAMGVQASYDPTFSLPEELPHIASYSSAVADVDGDGDLDLITNNLGDRVELFINQEGHKRNWVRLDVVGEYPNVLALGAGVETTVSGTTRFHEHYAGGNGYLGQNERILHVGLGDAERVDQLVCRWPSGGPTRTLTDLPAGEVWKLYPPSRLCDSDGDGVDHDDFEAFAACFLAGFTPGCEMMDFDGDSVVYPDDLDDCFVSAAQDCNGNGTEDLAEIMLDLGLDVDENDVIDCCEAMTATEPGKVGPTLFGLRDPLGQAQFDWTAPSVDVDHAAAASYDVFRATAHPAGPFALHGNVGVTSFTDTDVTPQIAYYVVSARNGCGSSGEEPF